MATDVPLGLSKPSDGYPISSVTLSGVITITSPNLQKHKSERIYKKYAFGFFQHGAQLATSPREANASACATHEPAPKGMVQSLFRPIRPWRDLRSKNGPLHRFCPPARRATHSHNGERNESACSSHFASNCKKRKNRSQWEIGCEEIENILKTAGFILFFLKKLPPPAKFQKAAGKVGIKLGKPP